MGGILPSDHARMRYTWRMTTQPFSLELLQQVAQPPALWTPGAPLFWDDPHISQSMLDAHLDPAHDAASRRPENIDRIVHWLIDALGLDAGAALLDIGCGPGLYAERFARRGLRVTGVDYSRRSIAYATESAQQQGLAITYRYQDYRTLEDTAQYDAALLIYGDLCVLNPQDRATVLANVRRALKPGGLFAFDVTTRELRQQYGLQPNWYVSDGGFWRPGLHLVLERGFDYPDESMYCDQYVIIEPDGTLTTYRNWFLDYTLETISAVLKRAGFAVRGAYNDLLGTPYAPGGDWIGVIAAAL